MIVNTPFIYDRNCIRIYEEITNNAITIDGIDYFVDSISPGYKNSKGANSYVFALYQAQNYIDDGSSVPDRVIKISNKEIIIIQYLKAINVSIERLKL